MDPNTNRPDDQQEPAPDYAFIREVNEAIEHHDTDKEKRKRMLIAGAGGVGLIIVVWMLAALIFSGGPDVTQRLLSIVQRQEEIIRISEIGTNTARDREVEQFATTTRAAIRSSQNDITRLIETRTGSRVSQNQLRAGENAQTTQELETALQANRFDITFITVIQDELIDYRTTMEIALRETDSANEREVLQSLIQEVGVLLNRISPEQVDEDPDTEDTDDE